MLITLRGLVVCGVLNGAALVAHADDWPHWRGPDRNDVVAEHSGWSGGEWKLGEAAWSRNVGEGATSPVVVDGRLYTTGWSDNREAVRCLDAATGDPIWTVSDQSPRYGRRSTGDKGIYAGTSATPAFDKQTLFLYTLGIDGDFVCWDTKQQGRRVWSVNFYDRFGVKQRPDVGGRRRTLRDYGFVGAPFVFGDVVVVEVGDDEGTLMAFDKRSGKRRWVSECRDEAGHTGGLAPITVEGVPCLAVLTLRNLVVVRLDSGHEGETVARYPWTTDFANNIPTPAVHEDSVIITSAYNQSAMCRLKITLEGAEKVWEQPNPSGVCSPVIHKGHVYWAWRGVHCVDFETGKERWVGGKVGTPGSCIVTADDRLIVWANKGDLTLVETAERSPARYRELAGRKRIFSRDVWPHAVLAGGRLYLKDREGNLKCFALPETGQ